MDDGRILSPREVYNEILEEEDEIAAWAKRRSRAFVDPTFVVQQEVRNILQLLPNPGIGDRADPFVIAEAKVRGLAVVTYEGRNFGGPTRRWWSKMPGLCQQFGVSCCLMPVPLQRLGGRF